VKLLLVRHAAAVPSGTPGIADDDRPLTPKGRAKFEKAARGLARVAPRPDVLLTSPLPRARATAEIAADAFGRVEPTVEPALAEGGVAGILSAIARHAKAETVGAVGHEPTLSAVLAKLLGAHGSAGLEFKKGGAALVDLPRGPMGEARLVWFLRPRILRDLAKL